jgi:hypothetical protein
VIVFRGDAGKENGNEEAEIAKNNLRREIKPSLRVYLCCENCILWHTDPLLGNGRETNDTTAIPMQHLRKYSTLLEPLPGSGPRTTMEVLLEPVFSNDPLRGYITRLIELSLISAVQWSELLGE